MADKTSSMTKESALAKLKYYKNKAVKLADKTAEKGELLFNTVEANAACLGAGMVRGMVGKPLAIDGVPLDLGVGLLATGLSLFMDRRMASHINAIGTGLTCHYSADLGRQIGENMNKKKTKTKKDDATPASRQLGAGGNSSVRSIYTRERQRAYQ